MRLQKSILSLIMLNWSVKTCLSKKIDIVFQVAPKNCDSNYILLNFYYFRLDLKGYWNVSFYLPLSRTKIYYIN